MKIILTGGFLLPIAAVSFSQTGQVDLSNFPEPFVGVQIVPAAELGIPANNIRSKQQSDNGYIYSESENPKYLMSVKNRLPREGLSKSNDPDYFYLKKNVGDINLTFYYQPVSQNNLLGFAPVGTENGEGWTGIREFFDDAKFGVCSLTKYHIVNSKMGIRINADAVTYVVNSLPTTLEVTGSEVSGFKYTVSWVDSVFSNHLECAKESFDNDQINQMVAFAGTSATDR